MKVPRVTFYTNSFNRLRLLQNLLRSFEACNEYPNFEWVITDFGSTDGSREWLDQYANHVSYRLQTVFADENDYFTSLKLPTLDRRTKTWSILRWYRNQARAAAHGDYYFDVATDHQFIRRGPWLLEIMEIFSDREQEVGQDDLASVVPFGYFRWRLDKSNNQRGPLKNEAHVPYYIAHQKGYVDYSVMKRSTAERIGPYWELTALRDHPEDIARWYANDPALQPEAEYCHRAEALGLKRAFMKYPVTISFRNRELATLVSTDVENGLIVPLWTLPDMENQFGHLRRPISSEELYRTPLPTVFERSLAQLQKWL